MQSQLTSLLTLVQKDHDTQESLDTQINIIIENIWRMKELFYATLQPGLDVEYINEQAIKVGAEITEPSLYRQWIDQLTSEYQEQLCTLSEQFQNLLTQQEFMVYKRTLSQLILVGLPKIGTREETTLEWGNDTPLRLFLSFQPRLVKFLFHHLSQLMNLSQSFKAYAKGKGLLPGQPSRPPYGLQNYIDISGNQFHIYIPRYGLSNSLFTEIFSKIDIPMSFGNAIAFKNWYLQEITTQITRSSSSFSILESLKARISNRCLRRVPEENMTFQDFIQTQFRTAIEDHDRNRANYLFIGKIRKLALVLNRKYAELIRKSAIMILHENLHYAIDPEIMDGGCHGIHQSSKYIKQFWHHRLQFHYQLIQQQANDLAHLMGKPIRSPKSLSYRSAILLADKNCDQLNKYIDQQISMIHETYFEEAKQTDYKGCGADLLWLSKLTRTGFEVHPAHYHAAKQRFVPAGSNVSYCANFNPASPIPKVTLLYNGRGYVRKTKPTY